MKNERPPWKHHLPHSGATVVSMALSNILLTTACGWLLTCAVPLYHHHSFSVGALQMPPLKGRKTHKTKEFSRRLNHPTSFKDSVAFKGPLRLPESDALVKCDDASVINLHERIQIYYDTNNLAFGAAFKPLSISSTLSTARTLRAITDHFASANAPIDVKEVMESTEFYLRTSKRLLSAVAQSTELSHNSNHTTTSARPHHALHVVDAACGHGLTGLLFAACNPTLQIYVTCVDSVEPPSHRRLLDLISDVCPWVNKDRVVYKNMTLESYAAEQHDVALTTTTMTDASFSPTLPSPPPMATLVVAIHACGALTDAVLEAATNRHQKQTQQADAIAVMPCCYTGTAVGAPYGLRRALGVSWAADIDRAYRLEEKGYRTDFCTIPHAITPMNRILVAERRR